MSWLLQADKDVILHVKVQPRAAHTSVAGILGDALKIRLQAPPVDGKANQALIRFLAKSLGIPARRITLVAGASARDKRLRISDCDAETVEARLLD